MNTERHLCCVKGCDWYYDVPWMMPNQDIYFDLRVGDDLIKQDWQRKHEETEAVLKAHLLTHPWFKLPKIMRKYLREKYGQRPYLFRLRRK